MKTTGREGKREEGREREGGEERERERKRKCVRSAKTSLLTFP